VKELRVFLLVKVTQIILFFCASEEFAFLPPERCDESKKETLPTLVTMLLQSPHLLTLQSAIQ